MVIEVDALIVTRNLLNNLEARLRTAAGAGWVDAASERSCTVLIELEPGDVDHAANGNPGNLLLVGHPRNLFCDVVRHLVYFQGRVIGCAWNDPRVRLPAARPLCKRVLPKDCRIPAVIEAAFSTDGWNYPQFQTFYY